MTDDHQHYVVATFDPRPGLWGYFLGKAGADAALKQAGKGFAAMPLAEYVERERAHYLGQPLRPIARAAFDEAFDMLPPIAHQPRGNFETFISPEPTSGPYHAMYARLGERCAVRIVNFRDRSTWVTPEEMRAAFPSFVQCEAARQAGQGRAAR